MISRKFVELWAPRFDAHKFLPDFYLRHLRAISARNTEQSQQFKEDLLALLHWKDGKASLYVAGEDHAKPNMLGPIRRLDGSSLADFKRIFDDLVRSEDNRLGVRIENLRRTLTSMYNTVVVPAFLLHVARPDHLPIIDQHTVRAFFALTRGEVQEKPKIDWEVWREYVAFFQKAAVDADCNHNREERCRVDHALFTWGKTLKSSARLLPGAEPPEPAKLKAEEKEPEMKPPLLWGQDIPRTGIVPTSANVLKASEEYVEAGSLNSLPPFKRQNLRDLHLHKFPQPDLRELIREPGGGAARKLLHYYKETMGGNADIMNLPRPIRDVFLVGWANCCGINGTTKNAKHLYKFRFGGTERAAMAVVAVGKSTGRLFGLLDDSDTPTALFHEYFEFKQ